MNFFIRYMRSQGKENWLGHPDEPLKGFSWKHGVDRQTFGIHLWDEVFLKATGKPFQRLVFLVRDSNNGLYGADAGRVLLEKRLEATQDMRPELQQLPKYIRGNFSNIECFLLPYPGKEVATKNSYDGCLKDIDEDFKDHLQEFVRRILEPSHLVVKQINGKKISCQELLAYFKAYVQVFRSGELPEPKSMLQATAEASHLTAKDKAAKVYLAVMSNELQGYYERQRIAEQHRLNKELEKEKKRQLQQAEIERKLAEMARKQEENERKQVETARKHREEIERNQAEMARKQWEEIERRQAELEDKHQKELKKKIEEVRAEQNSLTNVLCHTAEAASLVLSAGTAGLVAASAAVPTVIGTAAVGATCATIGMVCKAASYFKWFKKSA
ncbi:hypothetical protein MTO96_012572 [Rhipicephalus appendiculatus]